MNLLVKISEIAIVNEILNILLILAILLVIAYIVLFIISYFAFRKAFVPPKDIPIGKVSRRWSSFKEELADNIKELDQLEKEKIILKGYKNRKISANFINSKTKNNKIIIFSHGWKNTGINDYSCAGMLWHRNNYNVLIIDHQGHGDSVGKYIGFGGKIDRYNLKCWIDYLNEKFDNKCEIYLHGFSMGASAVLGLASEKLNNVKAIIADSGYVNAYEQCKFVIKKQYKFFGNIIAFNVRIYSSILAGYNFKKCDTKEAMLHSKYPILFLHGEKDSFVPNINSIENYNLCDSQKEIIIYDDASHTVACMMYPKKYQEDIFKFINKY